jgi:hypothetical protein
MHLDSEIHRPRRPWESSGDEDQQTGEMIDGRYAVDTCYPRSIAVR